MTSTKTLLLASELTGALPKLENYLTGDPGRRLLVIPTAGIGEGWMPAADQSKADDQWVPEYEAMIEPFEKFGFAVTVLDLSVQNEPLDEDFLQPFAAVYVSGGNTFFLLKHMKRTGFSYLVKKAVKNGLIYIGSSAGSVAATADIGYADSLDDRSLGDGDDTGLGFVGFAILPHLGHPSMGDAVLKAYESWSGERNVFALEDDQVILIEGHRIRVL